VTTPVIDHRRPREQRDSGLWVCEFKVEKFHGDDLTAEPYETHLTDNLLMAGGVSNLWECLIGNGGAGALAYFSNANAAIGVGDSTTAEAATQTDLQAATNKLRKGMNAGYPQHTDGVVVGSQSIVFQSTFGTSEANFAWQELVVANNVTAGAGRILNRKVTSLGTKTSASSWQVTATITIS
jgi:hypothetical protein